MLDFICNQYHMTKARRLWTIQKQSIKFYREALTQRPTILQHLLSYTSLRTEPFFCKYIRMEIVGIFSTRIQATIRKYKNTIRKCAPSKASKNIWDQNLQLTCSNSKRSQLPLLHSCKLSQQLNIFLYSVKCKFCAVHQILQYVILSDTFSGAFLPRQVSATVDVWIAFGHFPKQKITMDHTKFPIHTREVWISN